MIMNKRFNLTWLAWSVVVAIMCYLLLPNLLLDDSLKMSIASSIPGADTWSYWRAIFTGPNHGPQYRPIGFFAYFYVFSKLFGANPIPYHLFSYILFILSLYQIMKLADKLLPGQLWLN